MSQAHERHYGKIFLGLFGLTVLESAVAGFHFMPKFYIVLSLIGLAVTKALMVAMFYMHLKFEKRLLYVIAFAPLIFSIIMTQAVGFDMKRNEPKIISHPSAMGTEAAH